MSTSRQGKQSEPRGDVRKNISSVPIEDLGTAMRAGFQFDFFFSSWKQLGPLTDEFSTFCEGFHHKRTLDIEIPTVRLSKP